MRDHLLRWRALDRTLNVRTSTPRVRPSGAAWHLGLLVALAGAAPVLGAMDRVRRRDHLVHARAVPVPARHRVPVALGGLPRALADRRLVDSESMAALDQRLAVD